MTWLLGVLMVASCLPQPEPFVLSLHGRARYREASWRFELLAKLNIDLDGLVLLGRCSSSDPRTGPGQRHLHRARAVDGKQEER